MYIGYSAVQGTSSPHMVRPHPSFWKLVHGVMICYLCFMVYLLFQNIDEARLFLKVRVEYIWPWGNVDQVCPIGERYTIS